MKFSGLPSLNKLSFAILTASLGATGAYAAGHGDHGHEGHGHDDAHEMEQHDKHSHGESELELVLDGEHLNITLHGPAANFVGFEYKPKTEAEEHAVSEMLHTLEEGVVMLAKAADCELEKVTVEHGFGEIEDHHDDHGAHEKHDDHAHEEHAKHDDHHDDHDKHDDHHDEHKHDDHDEERHSEVEVSYEYHCHKPADIKSVEFTLFKQFPMTEAVDFQAIANGRQFGGEMTSESYRIDL